MSFTAAQMNALMAEGVSAGAINRAAARLAPARPAPKREIASAGGRRIGPRAVAMLHHFEGCKLKAYRCPAGIWTIGWGNTFYENGVPVASGDAITQARADELFGLVLAKFEAAVEKEAPGSAPHHFGAMVSFAYNVGISAFTRSTLLRLHKAGNLSGAAEQFLRWDKAGGQTVAGLTRRRSAERLLYLNNLPAFDKAIGYRA